jgi:hypothetical protein
MPTNNTFIMLGLGAAALLFMNRGGSEEDQVDQLAGAAMMASGEGTAPDAPFQAYSAPSNPSFFFNEGGQMAKVTARSNGAAHKQPYTEPELEFEVKKTNTAVGTTDNSLTTPEFASTGDWTVESAAIWDDQAKIANANFMPLLAVQDAEGGGIKVLGSNVDISTLSSKEQFRAVNLNKPGAITSGFTTTGEVLGEYVQGFIDNPPPAYIPSPGITAQQSTDEDIGVYPGGGNQPELEFTVARSLPPDGTTDISPTTPQFAGPSGVNVTASTVWDQQALSSPFLGVQPAVSRGDFFALEGGAFGPNAFETIQSTVRPEAVEDLRPGLNFKSSPSVPAWAGGDNWWDEG